MAVGEGVSLAALGLRPAAERVYRQLLRHPGAGMARLAELSELPHMHLLECLDELAELSLLQAPADDPRAVTPVSPERGLTGLLSRQERQLVQRQQQIERCRTEVAHIVADFTTSHPPIEDPFVERLEGIDAVRLKIAELSRSVRFETAALLPTAERSADAMAAARPLDEAALNRGVRLRTVQLDGMRRHKSTVEYARWMTELGGEVRTAPSVPLRLLMMDREVALVPLAVEHSRGGALLLHGTGMVAAVQALFESTWRTARPLDRPHRPRRPEGLTEQERVVLRLLGQGHTDEQIARRLAVSDRTVRRVVAQLMERLGARSRFQAGVLAMSRGLVEAV